MFERAETLTRAGQTVILDATFTSPFMRTAAAAVAARTGVPFQGLWLTASEAVLTHRVRAGTGDASDADVAVLGAQLAGDLGEMLWDAVDASGTPKTVRDKAQQFLRRCGA
ncbi:AAA domain-containing protein [Alloyangia pacifica]|uniref:AAA domain-containing protein n=2 Tax=Alloyangia pacifica TaxID=311180 RepID=A0A1I6UV90_9RHOB|nr:AAA domain-containing protein [Alloyangia pacifica]SFT05388.1 AAA domain-containing protein [Alloyangia pacifica]